jgi:hypothetical protein
MQKTKGWQCLIFIEAIIDGGDLCDMVNVKNLVWGGNSS